VVDFPAAHDKSLELRDKDPYDMARAERVFPQSEQVTVRLRVMAGVAHAGQLFIEVADHRGVKPLQVYLAADVLCSKEARCFLIFPG
jgi:hypothetical protein